MCGSNIKTVDEERFIRKRTYILLVNGHDEVDTAVPSKNTTISFKRSIIFKSNTSVKTAKSEKCIFWVHSMTFFYEKPVVLPKMHAFFSIWVLQT